ncbi:deoxyguanosinetriphosphate triphosphohydrolase [candidate division WOR-1 bacterium RIFOXYA12_FULL_43_27]|uniref:Deoxyguanosinetriphosphate triphosphohydrolase n=1 Tax=candidate division WOR-1 bacterium RIFOXYC2_FULL_46_14 TaxID=1802587 RepID=A0A1F4U4F6_UNCSA|nr:MAG: deoxyguanosinetriphosphate triphosphohydrolase [candidate division WOR-1 bacterium RIFOXYA12_FULL_43_27]OGC20909.1 MAG: deoxyguanosinetriphosphate triphosphohydrolase [candidate division WOR-1 bacterium RIFOXYB2_FULL_46_45]OGC31353.1 MAG: deoxyguanosinetriphosphate triphosphohydrolase [candidate division WOR-1 bacterium RIFOXYA2_FULL_46_56]OGC39759.1 MAG: deoxyguanosinetriphosphate triphosphohydrolase [candidate division WOR-1 bacterium RIFOXYC2_FULL_46_14]
MIIRREIEEREKKLLSPYACFASKTAGRAKPEKECNLRTAFQRDRDKIIHSKSFRRLKHKTQVFISPIGDHYRTRLTHTLEVAQIARTIARALRLNEDLTEAIALGHDLGHTPFGHAGEAVLNQILKEFGGHFHHSEQSVRVVTVLDKLNLCKEVIEGIALHTHTAEWPKTLEATAVRLADRIAYIRHDTEDAINAGILKKGSLPRKAMDVLKVHMLDTILFDIIKTSRGKPYVKMGKKVGAAVQNMYNFLYKRVYTNATAKAEETKLPALLRLLFRHYLYHPKELPGYKRKMEQKEILRLTTDFISGMSDRYASEKFEELFVPKEWHK